jgi:stage II sporulation protein D
VRRYKVINAALNPIKTSAIGLFLPNVKVFASVLTVLIRMTLRPLAIPQLLKVIYPYFSLLSIKRIIPFLLPLLLGSAAIRHPAPIAHSLAPTDSPSTTFDPNLFLPPAVPGTSSSLAARPTNTAARDPFAPLSSSRPNSRKQSAAAAASSSASAARSAALPSILPPAIQAPQPAQTAPIPIRVGVAINVETLSVATNDAGVIADPEGHILQSLSPDVAVAIAPTDGGLQVGDRVLPNGIWIKPQSTNGLTFVEGKWYRGPVQIIWRDKGLLAVNHTDLESYLYSVVGSEMPASWPLEALKAQAVAARSYALVHIARPASDDFDLGATPRWQAYNGVETETDTTQTAVEATRGILLSYDGGVVESLYASHESLVQEAHSGFGMSQNGANELAQRSYSYQQILAHFYPGTQLATLQLQ